MEKPVVGADAYKPVPGFEPRHGEKYARITARKLVWEIPETKKDGKGNG